ncbi:MAG: ABC transporter ATP-binding protein, partial [Pseudomonadota bacterium]
ALVAAVPVAIGVALYVLQFSGFRHAAATYTSHIEAVNASAIEFVQGASVMKTFGHRGARDGRFRASTERFVDFFWHWVRKTMALSSAAEIAFSPLISVILIAVCGIAMVQLGWLEIFELLPFLLLAPSLAAPFITLSFAQNQMMLSEEAAARIGALFEAPVLPLASDPKTPTGYDVTFDKVSFSYDGETQALSDINLSLKQGTVTALVGPSGGGKSTLAQLLPRFWDPTEGEIRLGGVPLNQIDPQQLYRAVGFVFQNVQLVSGSVADNIALGQPDASREAIETAARKAQIYDKITSLPRGFDSIIGEDVHLSGGEAQRVSIARALLVNAPVLVLDEATAYADPQSEAALQKAISELIIGKTVLVIAHRLYTITGADQICVLKNGRIVESGTHDSLLAEGGTYDALWRASRSGSSREAPR